MPYRRLLSTNVFATADGILLDVDAHFMVCTNLLRKDTGNERTGSPGGEEKARNISIAAKGRKIVELARNMRAAPCFPLSLSGGRMRIARPSSSVVSAIRMSSQVRARGPDIRKQKKKAHNKPAQRRAKPTLSVK